MMACLAEDMVRGVIYIRWVPIIAVMSTQKEPVNNTVIPQSHQSLNGPDYELIGTLLAIYTAALA